jgi:hypothetical protein
VSTGFVVTDRFLADFGVGLQAAHASIELTSYRAASCDDCREVAPIFPPLDTERPGRPLAAGVRHGDTVSGWEDVIVARDRLVQESQLLLAVSLSQGTVL